MRSGAVVRALASQQCGPGSNPGVDAIHACGLSLLLVLVLAPRGFSRCISVFPLLKNKHFQIPFRSGTHGHVSTTSWELLNAPWVKKCQVTIFLPVPNLYPELVLVLGHRLTHRIYLKIDLKGYSQLWDRADLNTSFASLKSVYLNLKLNVSVGYI